MRSEDGDTVAIFNGEIYNHAELRVELESLGHCFRTRCYTEVLLKAFLEWDVHCFSRLRGMFAVGLWSESRHRLVLARDRLGIKPLYVHRQGYPTSASARFPLTLFGHAEEFPAAARSYGTTTTI